MSFRMAKVGELKVGSYAIINGVPSRIAQVTKSKPGKHGSAKFRCTAISLFDGSKQSFVDSTGANIQIPIVDKRSGQVVALTGNTAQIMDIETYETFEAEVPEELEGKVTQGCEVLYWVIMGRKMLVSVK